MEPVNLHPPSVFLSWAAVPKLPVTFRLVQLLSSREADLEFLMCVWCGSTLYISAGCVKWLSVWINSDSEHNCSDWLKDTFFWWEEIWQWMNMDEGSEDVYQQVQHCCPRFKWFACISWERALFGRREGDGLSLMQLWSGLIEGRSFWWVLRTSWTGFPEYVWLSSLWEREKRGVSLLQPSPADTSLDTAKLALRTGDGGLKAGKEVFLGKLRLPLFPIAWHRRNTEGWIVSFGKWETDRWQMYGKYN